MKNLMVTAYGREFPADILQFAVVRNYPEEVGGNANVVKMGDALKDKYGQKPLAVWLWKIADAELHIEDLARKDRS